MQLAQYIEHSYLRPDCHEQMIERLISETQAYSFKAICIPPMYLPYVHDLVAERTFLLVTVAGFPIGYDHVGAKIASISESAQIGVDEIDVVLNLSAIKTGHWNFVRNEIQALSEISEKTGVGLKYILETEWMTEDEIMRICELSNSLKVNFIKTSTGFFGEAVKEETIKLLRRHLDPHIKIKASGGVSTYQQAVKLIRAGADRIGSSHGVEILESQPE